MGPRAYKRGVVTGGLTQTLLLTRPEAQSAAFLGECQQQLGRVLPAVISPVFEIVPVGDVPDLEGFETVVVTSQNAVRRTGEALRGCDVLTVGARTAELARSFGAQATCLGESVERFLDAARAIKPPVIYVRGRHTRGDLAERLRRLGTEVEERVIYDQAEKPLSAEALDVLRTGHVVLPVFSPRSAALLAANAMAETVTVLAISDAAASAWTGPGEVRVAKRPDSTAMIALIGEAF